MTLLMQISNNNVTSTRKEELKGFFLSVCGEKIFSGILTLKIKELANESTWGRNSIKRINCKLLFSLYVCMSLSPDTNLFRLPSYVSGYRLCQNGLF